MTQHDEFIAWGAGRNDAFGEPFSDWLLARYDSEGRVMRDAQSRQIYETQAEYLARKNEPITQPAQRAQLELFA